MEVINGVVVKPCPSSSRLYTQTAEASNSSSLSNSHVWFRKENRIPTFREVILRGGNGIDQGFENKGHLEYYSRVVTPVCGERKGKGKKGWNEIPVKKRMKLWKSLVEDLSTFSDIQGFVADDDKSRAISEAAETLLAQLKQLRAEEEQIKKCSSLDCESSSSSSSSESGDSECDEVVDIKCVNNKALVQPVDSKGVCLVSEEPSSVTPNLLQEQSMREQLSQNSEQKCCNMVLDMTLNKDAGIEVLDADTLKFGSMEMKIEVCMGGKCKKLGAPALMQEFQRVMGSEGVVQGCKCMGKCKSAPNVRVLNGNVGCDTLRTSNPLCTGVGLEDVEVIVANYFGEGSMDQLRVAVAGLPS